MWDEMLDRQYDQEEDEPGAESTMREIKLTVPEETPLALRGSAKAAGEEVRLAAAVRLFEIGRLSSGAAAALAGPPSTLFLPRLADFGVPTFTLAQEELQGDLGSA